ncbi:T9SS type A sorting domain-containing protein, partial [bacterium]|nr:T9SS type A sorting domain-containing protein [bacterium]
VIVYESDSAGFSEIFLECPYDFCTPLRLSYSSGFCTMPAIVVDDSGGVHVVWQYNLLGNSEIYYYYSSSYCVPGTSINLSHSSMIYDTYPTISIFNGQQVHVLWRSEDPPCETPYSIRHAYLSDRIWSAHEAIAYDWMHLDHPSLDYCHGEDSLSACWENRGDAFFYGGNGGGDSTTGFSGYPVVSTVGLTWSYLYWEDNSDDREDIMAQNYYDGLSPHHWTSYKFRDVYDDVEVHYPSVSNCCVIWTQGSDAPYEVRFRYEEYPTAVEEFQVQPTEYSITAYPNPFNHATTITFEFNNPAYLQIYSSPRITMLADWQVKIYDLAGHIISEFHGNLHPSNHNLPNHEEILWAPEPTVPTGIYIIRADFGDIQLSKRVIFAK